MTRRYFSGKTLDQAVMMAARHHGLDPEELAYRQIEKRHGFLRTRKAVVIAVDPERPRKGPAASAAAPPAEAAASPVAAAGAAESPTADVSAPTAATETPPEAAPPAEAAPAVEAVPAVEVAPAVEATPAAAEIEDSAPPGSPMDLLTRPAIEQEQAEASPPGAAPEAAPEPRPPAVEMPAAEGPAPEPPAPAESAPVAEDPAPAPRATVEHDQELLSAAEEASQTLLRFAGIEAAATARSGDERVEVEIEGPDSSVLVVEGGKGLLAVQHLLPRMLRGLTGRTSFVRVDSQGFHQQRRERLEALALKEAESAHRSGRSRMLPPMAPDERRIVHLALKDVPTVVTESRGSGLHKRVVVRPADEVHDVEARHGF